MDLQFYQQMKPLRSFTEVARRKSFVPAPSNWSLILSDIRNSTRAIEQGRYKEVNLIGAATIVAVQNFLGTRHFPFVFGGDGATLLLPSSLCQQAVPVLRRLQRLAQDQFNLQLRMAIVTLPEIYQRGGQVLVAKYQISPHNDLAMFHGGGLALAEQLVKTDPAGERYLLQPAEESQPPRLDSLSCRWAPIPNRNGKIVSVIVQALRPESSERIYQSILDEIHPIFEDQVNRPVSRVGMRQEPLFKNLRRELALRKDLTWKEAFWKILVPMIFTRVALHLSSKPFAQPFIKYVADTVENSDYKKFDDTLRMVLDCKPEQAQRLEAILQRHYQSHDIIYGLHYSDAALMTCIMEGLEQDQHLHFIDGSNGGYAMAAKAMKEQKKISGMAGGAGMLIKNAGS